MQSLMALPRPPLHRLQKAIETRMRGRGDGPLTKLLHVGWLDRKQKLPCKIHQQTVRLPIGEGNKLGMGLRLHARLTEDSRRGLVWLFDCLVERRLNHACPKRSVSKLGDVGCPKKKPELALGARGGYLPRMIETLKPCAFKPGNPASLPPNPQSPHKL